MNELLLGDVLDIARLSDVGLHRERNEDVVASDLSTGLVVLADGMGGYQAGDVASEIAVLSITADIAEAKCGVYSGKKKHFYPKTALERAVKHVNSVIYRISTQSQRHEGMGTTLVAGLFVDNKLTVGYVGDSRLYRLRSYELEQLTEDHSYVQMQIKAGTLTSSEARHSPNKYLVTRALGVDSEVKLEIREFGVKPDDVYLFCSDGLTDLVTDEEIRIKLINAEANLDLAAHELISYANKQGGTDNISVILVRVKKSFANKPFWLKRMLGRV